MAYIDEQAQFWTELREQRDHPDVSMPYAGPMATMEASAPFRAWLPAALDLYDIKTMLDVPCGCWNWMQHVDLGDVKYTGWDVEPEIVNRNITRHGGGKKTFRQANLLTIDRLPKVDLILCRDFLMHMPDENISLILKKFIASGSKYLLTSNFPGAVNDFPYNPDRDTLKGEARVFDLTADPFNMIGMVDRLWEQGDRTMDLYSLGANR